MKKKYFMLCGLCWCCITLMIAQDAPNKPFRMATLEASVTGFPLDDYVDPATGTVHPFFENSVHIGVLTNLNQHWRVGLNYNYLWTQFRKQQMGTFFIAGLDVRYERNIFDRFNLYADVLLQTGNYCPCLKDIRIDEFPYKRDHSWYWGIGK